MDSDANTSKDTNEFPPMPQGFVFGTPDRERNPDAEQRAIVEALFMIIVNHKMPATGVFSPGASYALLHNGQAAS